MCGIAGQALAHREQRPDPRSIRAAVALLKHRGPDDDGVFEAPGIFLGHTRLSITGILRGHQPVANETGSVQVVFNGEIYNHAELRRQLAARGHHLDGESDSAVLPHAYEEWGASFVERLEGIFAIAVWDAVERRLLLCRDRFGVKPLYYAHDPDGLVFGSELKAVAVARPAPPEIDPAAVGRECVSETPVGAFLSGGLDSSAIAALMTERLRRPFPTFHVGFREASFGEQEFARAVSAHLGTIHREVICSAEDVPRLLPALAWHLDNPTADVSALAEFMVADLARASVKVVLSGDGGDEVLAGYPTYKADRIADLLIAAKLRRPAAWALGALEPLVPPGRRKLGAGEKIRRFRRGLAAATGHPHVRWRTVFSEAERRALVVPDAGGFLEDTWGRALGWLGGTERWPALTRYQWLDMRVWLDGCVLRKVDALAMAHAIEVRVPFLDHRVVEAALATPTSLRLRGWTDKYALRRIMSGRLPENIRRRPKAPFQMPLDSWFRGPLLGYAREQFAAGGLTTLPMLSLQTTAGVLEAHAAGRESAGVQLWALLMLGGWAEHFYGRLPALRARASGPSSLLVAP